VPKIELGKFSSLIRRYLGMTGTSDVLDELAYEISPVLVLEAESIDWEFLKGARVLASAQKVGAVAGQNSAARWRNPATSNTVAIFTSLNVGVGPNPAPAASIVNVTHNVAEANNQTTVHGYTVRDSRAAPPFGGAVVFSSGIVAAGGTLIDMCACPAVSSFPIWRGKTFVLMPGAALNVSLENQNLELVVGAHWIERGLSPQELAP
jgi:hypothetical protein